MEMDPNPMKVRTASDSFVTVGSPLTAAQLPYMALEHVTPSAGGSVTATVPYGTPLVVFAVVFANMCLRGVFNAIAEMVEGELPLSVAQALIFFALTLVALIKNRRTELRFDLPSQLLYSRETRLLPGCCSCGCCADVQRVLPFADLAGAAVIATDACCGCCASQEVWCRTAGGVDLRLAAAPRAAAGGDTVADWRAVILSLPLVQPDQAVGPERPTNVRQDGPDREVTTTPYTTAYTVLATLTATNLFFDTVSFLLLLLLGHPWRDRILQLFAVVVGSVLTAVFLLLNRKTHLVFDRRRRTVSVTDTTACPCSCSDVALDIDFGDLGGVFARSKCCCCCSTIEVFVETRAPCGPIRLGTAATPQAAELLTALWTEHIRGLFATQV
jgi:hypothetical protein